ncbi:hypothetical protein MHYP_G00032010 [Metynnis hypsauchen]
MTLFLSQRRVSLTEPLPGHARAAPCPSAVGGLPDEYSRKSAVIGRGRRAVGFVPAVHSAVTLRSPSSLDLNGTKTLPSASVSRLRRPLLAFSPLLSWEGNVAVRI